MKTSTHLTFTLLLLALLAACVGQRTVHETAPAEEAAPAAESEPAEEAAQDEAAVDTTSARAQEVSEETASEEVAEANNGCEEGFRLFDHEMLATDPVCIPEEPQRIVNFDLPSTLYPLDIKPIAGTFLELNAIELPMVADWIMTDIEELNFSEPSLEQLTLLEPDLIIGDLFFADNYDEFSAIAPTLIVNYDFGSPTALSDDNLFLGEVTGRETEAIAQLALYDQRVAELKTALQANLGDLSAIDVSLIRARDENTFDVYPRNRPQAALFDTLGFGRPAAIDYDRAGILEVYDTDNLIPISKERLDLADGDVLIIAVAPNVDEEETSLSATLGESIENDPLWNTLNAFQQNEVHFVTTAWVLAGKDLIAAHNVLDDLANMFGVEIPTPNPFVSE